MSEPTSALLSRHNLLVATAVLEFASGLLMIFLPAQGLWLLLGVSDPAPAALAAGRLYGAALTALGVACWYLRDAPGSGIVRGMLVYNVGACSLLPWVATTAGLAGILLWPAVLLHAALTLWCVRVPTS